MARNRPTPLTPSTALPGSKGRLEPDPCPISVKRAYQTRVLLPTCVDLERIYFFPAFIYLEDSNKNRALAAITIEMALSRSFLS